MLVAQFGAGADDGPAKPFTKDLQRWTDHEGVAGRISFQVFLTCNCSSIHVLQNFLSTDSLLRMVLEPMGKLPSAGGPGSARHGLNRRDLEGYRSPSSRVLRQGQAGDSR